MKNLQQTIENISLIANKEKFNSDSFKETEFAFKTYRLAIHNTKVPEFIKLIDEQFNSYLDSVEIQEQIISGIRLIINKKSFIENSLVKKDQSFSNCDVRYLTVSGNEYFVLLKDNESEKYQLYRYIDNEEQFFNDHLIYLAFSDLKFVVVYLAKEFGIEITVEELEL